MKKKLYAFALSLVTVVLALIMASGCSFVNTSVKNKNVSVLSDSSVAAQNVSFGTTAKSRNVDDALIDAVDAVKGSAVQLLAGNSAGSGVIVDLSFEDSETNDAAWKHDDNIVYIVTCHHMLCKSDTNGTEGIGEIEIRLPDQNDSYYNPDYIFYGYVGNEEPSVYNSRNVSGSDTVKYAITLVGGDFESDIALLKLDLGIAAKSGNLLSKDKVVKAQIPDGAYSARLGETVFSIGNPTGTLPGSVARGVISYLARATAVNEVGEMVLMQIDVSTNPGSSGGGLYNIYGELIGITNAGNTNYTNINFAIPCYLANGNGFVDIIRQLAGTADEVNYGYVSGRRVKFGFSITESADNNSTCVVISSVTSGSIAAKQGLKKDDIVEKIKVDDGAEQTITTRSEFAAIFDNVQAGQTITLTLSRNITYGFRITTQTVIVNMTAENFRFCDTSNQ